MLLLATATLVQCNQQRTAWGKAAASERTPPRGATTITRKTKDPVWRPTPRMRQEDPKLPPEVTKGPENPLGAYALYLGWPSYLIHGTNKPKAVGRRASSGCIRMYDDHIAWIFRNVPIGAPVMSVNQPIKMAWLNGDLYLEAEPNDIQIDEIEYQNRQITIDVPNGVLNKIRAKAGDQASRIDWEKVRSVLVLRSGIPVKITRPAKKV
jgi:L,D-transpeptidase ErfK/SrfK